MQLGLIFEHLNMFSKPNVKKTELQLTTIMKDHYIIVKLIQLSNIRYIE